MEGHLSKIGTEEYPTSADEMSPLWKIIRFAGGVFCVLLVIILIEGFLHLSDPFGGYDLLFEELVTGFYFFLHKNLPAISWDAGTWAPGVGAFSIAMIFIHRFLRAWSVRTHRHWSYASTLCLMSLLPVLFIISFIVPGVLLQWELLRQTPWIDVR